MKLVLPPLSIPRSPWPAWSLVAGLAVLSTAPAWAEDNTLFDDAPSTDAPAATSAMDYAAQSEVLSPTAAMDGAPVGPAAAPAAADLALDPTPEVAADAAVATSDGEAVPEKAAKPAMLRARKAKKVEAPAAPTAIATATASAAPASTTEATPVVAATPAVPVSDGSPIAIEKLAATITPPAGWEIDKDSSSISLVLREPRDPRPNYDHAKYQRNITVAAIQNPSPIDDIRAKSFVADLKANFGKDTSLADFEVTEQKFFNYKGEGDGLVVYSKMTMGETPMMQMHVLVSGQDRQYLLTYTDMHERFVAKEDKGFEQAWNSMVSLQVQGVAPTRGFGTLVYAGFALLGALALGAIFAGVRRLKRVDYGGEADAMIEAESSMVFSATTAATSHEQSLSALSGFGASAVSAATTALTAKPRRNAGWFKRRAKVTADTAPKIKGKAGAKARAASAVSGFASSRHFASRVGDNHAPVSMAPSAFSHF